VKLIIRDRMTKLRSVSHHQFPVLTQKAQNVIYSKAHDTIHIALFCGLYAIQDGFIHAVPYKWQLMISNQQLPADPHHTLLYIPYMR
jgi:hypothetical protein